MRLVPPTPSAEETSPGSVSGLGFRAWGFKLRVQVSGFKIEGSWFKGEGLWFRVYVSGLRV